MTPAIGRLKTRPEFLKVAASRCKWVAPGLILQVLQRGSTGQSSDHSAQSGTGLRVGFTVSRKVGNAVKRNRARRRLRAVVDEVMPELGRPDHDYVVIGRGSTLTRDFEDLKSDLRVSIARATTSKGFGSKRGSKGRKGSTRGPTTGPASKGS
ncbi:ribonuclease P protein component [Denitrobaculum tricleocarpae]|uniref:Ribonuclease P protein component n=1 Tax=Denitrobaculum tricleocarpae TaxID=2591009 RepID=A0A545U1C9_9PROT|nr:ribonuclease P protein component [Denitrobaculum tricleocarpae]TQV83281.1 ribonuclease P protein component [Denitrobaculum tricleocarpae]